jgi:FkbM family methyltransferase
VTRPRVKGLASALLERLPGPARRSARRAYYARLLRAAREEDQVDLSFLKRVVGRGDCVVDAGASIGLYTRFLSALVGPEGLVYSVEPVPDTYDVLVSNVRRLGLRNVRPLNYALSDADGALEMEVPRWPYGGENLYEARVAGAAPSGFRRIGVAARKLDTLVADRPVAFVKCDVEGHELRCLDGAAEMLRRRRPAWLLEVWGDPDAEGSHARRVFLAMERLGYAAHCYDGRRLEPRARGRRSDNYWFLTADHVRRLGEGGPPGGLR